MTTFRAFAKAIGVSHQAVSKAAQTGRLSRSLGRDRHGRPCIADVALARREWCDNAGQPTKDEGPDCVAAPEDDADIADMFFALLGYVILEHAPETVTKWAKDGRPREVDIAALRRWLAARGYDGATMPRPRQAEQEDAGA